MMHPSILYKLFALTLSINRGVESLRPLTINHMPRAHTAVFMMSTISVGVSAIVEAIASVSAAILAARAAHNWIEVKRLQQELAELNKELEEAEPEADDASEEESESDESIDEDEVSQDDVSSEAVVEDENVAEEDEPKTVEDVLEGAELEESKGSLKQYGKEGGFAQAEEDFDSLQLRDVRRIGLVRVGILPDGSKVIVREGSREGRPTLEIQKAGSNRVIKIRYN